LKDIIIDIKLIYKNLINQYIMEINNHNDINENDKLFIIDKLKYIKIKIGFPKIYKMYKYKISNNSIKNIFIINMNNYKNYQINYYNNNKKYWPISALDVNACYLGNYNKIIIPFGILNKPFYDLSYPLYKKYSIIGSIIGHEISHAIDNNNLFINKEGLLINIKERKIILFEKEIKKLNKQFEKLDLLSKNKISENIADLYGLSISLLTYINLFKEHKFKNFFNSYARLWRSIYKLNKKKYLLKNDVHSLPEHRTNLILHNINKYREIYNKNKNKNTINIFNV